MPKLTLSIAALVAANLVPLVGVVLFGWDAAVIVLLYWTENVVTGFYSILKMALARVEKPAEQLGKLFIIPFFCVHFGGFCAVHGAFLLAFFKIGGGFPDLNMHWPGPLMFVGLLVSVIAQLWQSRPPGMEWPVLCLLTSHGVSFVQNYLVGGEYARLSPGVLMGQPYGRIVLLHVAIIAGGLPVMLLGSPVPLLIILIGLKIVVDIALHNRSHGAGQQGKDGEDGPAALQGKAARRAPRAKGAGKAKRGKR